MQLENVTQLGQPTVADLASAVGQGVAEARSLLHPLLPPLYTFLARRSQDAEEAQDLLVDTLVLGRASALAHPTPLPLLPWLLHLGLRTLRSRIEQDSLLEAGLRPGWAVPNPGRPELFAALERLPADQRQAFGMYYGDGLPKNLIGEVLGSRAPGTLLEQGLTALQQTVARAGVTLTAPAVEAFLSELRSPVTLSEAEKERVWQRYEEEHEAFVPGRVLPVLPRWVPRLLGGTGVLGLLLAAALWYLGRPIDTPVAGIVSEPTQAIATDPSLVRPALLTPIPGRPWERPPVRSSQAGQDTGSVRFRHQGALYYLERVGERGMRLMTTELDSPFPNTEPRPRALLLLPGDITKYAVSPSDSRVAYVSGSDVWVRDGGETLRFAGRASREQVRALTWHSEGRLIAIATGDPTARQDYQVTNRIETVRPDTGKRSLLTSLVTSTPVYSLAYSPSGRYLLATTHLGALVVDTERASKPLQLPREVLRAYWSPTGTPERLLWTGATQAGTGEQPFGTVSVDGAALKRLGQGVFVSWDPDGRSVIAGRGMSRGALGFSRYDVRNGEQEEIGEMASLTAATDVAFGPDGRHLAYIGEDGLYLAHLGRNSAERIVSATGVSSLVWSPATPTPAWESQRNP